MSFASPKKYIEEGDTVILYLSINRIHAIQVIEKVLSKKGVLINNILQTQYGAIKPYSLIGTEYGKRIKLTSGWGYVLQPTPELWTLTLPHRTQIIYTPDISMILLQLDIKPGKIVIESGTGSGSLSHSIIQTLKPSGHLHTFDFHEQRVNMAKDEFSVHGLSDWVSVYHRDVCTDGFGQDLNGKADAVFLDLPVPWNAIPFAIEAFKPSGGYICSFSPCIEQVQKTCEKLLELCFEDIRTMEIIQTERRVQNRIMPSLDLDFLKVEKDNSTDERTNYNSPIKQKKRKFEKQNSTDSTDKQVPGCIMKVTSVPPQTQTGHTGYLTFAMLPPAWIRRKYSETSEEDKE